MYHCNRLAQILNMLTCLFSKAQMNILIVQAFSALLLPLKSSATYCPVLLRGCGCLRLYFSIHLTSRLLRCTGTPPLAGSGTLDSLILFRSVALESASTSLSFIPYFLVVPDLMNVLLADTYNNSHPQRLNILKTEDRCLLTAEFPLIGIKHNHICAFVLCIVAEYGRRITVDMIQVHSNACP